MVRPPVASVCPKLDRRVIPKPSSMSLNCCGEYELPPMKPVRTEETSQSLKSGLWSIAKNSVGTELTIVHLKSRMSDSSTVVFLDAGSTRHPPTLHAAMMLTDMLKQWNTGSAPRNTSSQVAPRSLA